MDRCILEQQSNDKSKTKQKSKYYKLKEGLSVTALIANKKEGSADFP